jgi:hypothetical protein
MQPIGVPFTIHEFLMSNDRNYSEADAANDTVQTDKIIKDTWDSMVPTGWTANIADSVENFARDEITHNLFKAGDKHILAGFTGQYNDTAQLVKIANGVWSTDYVIIKQAAPEKGDLNLSQHLSHIHLDGLLHPQMLEPRLSHKFMEDLIATDPTIASDTGKMHGDTISGAPWGLPGQQITYTNSDGTENGRVHVTVVDMP